MVILALLVSCASHSVPYATQRWSLEVVNKTRNTMPHIVCLMRLRGGRDIALDSGRSTASHSVPYATQRWALLLLRLLRMTSLT